MQFGYSLKLKAIKPALLMLLLSASSSAVCDVLDGQFFSPALGVNKAYRVYLPAAYSSEAKSYPVIYLLHGWGVNERSWTDTLKVHEIADRLNLQTLIVMPDGDRSLYANAATAVDYQACLNELKPTTNPKESRTEFCVQSANYEDYIVGDLIAEIDSHFRTIRAPAARALSGESAGGTGALSLALRNPQAFSSAASHSGIVAFLYDGPYPFLSGQSRFITELNLAQQSPEVTAIYGEDIANWRVHDPYSLVADQATTDLALYLDCGAEDDFQFDALAAALGELLTAKGIDHEYHSIPGKHNDELFGVRIEYSLRFHMRHFDLADSQ